MACCFCCCNEPKTDAPFASPARAPPNPKIFPQYVQNEQGLWLRWQQWWPLDRTVPLKGVMFLVQGYAEHTARYDSIARRFTEKGFVCFAMDHQGQGGSEGTRGYVEKFDHFVNDYMQFIAERFSPEITGGLSNDYKDLPRYLLGHSMGGLIATHLCYRLPENFWSGVVLSGPLLAADPKLATPSKVSMARRLSAWAPQMALGDVIFDDICTNPQVVELAKNDPFARPEHKIRARHAHELLVAMDAVFENIAKATFPMCIVHGERDLLTQPAGSQKFYDAAPSTDKTIKIFGGLKHEVLLEATCDTVYDVIMPFVDARIYDVPMPTEIEKVGKKATKAASGLLDMAAGKAASMLGDSKLEETAAEAKRRVGLDGKEWQCPLAAPPALPPHVVKFLQQRANEKREPIAAPAAAPAVKGMA